MSVYQLFVEGNTDTQIINAINSAANGNLLIKAKGPKDSLPGKVISERTKPNLSDFSLPDDLSEPSIQCWMHQEASDFCKKVEVVLSEQAITEKFTAFKKSFSLEKCSDISWVLHTFPGKDLFAGLSSWLAEHDLDPGRLKGHVVSYVTRNPDKAVSLVPEWQELIQLWSTPLAT